MKAPVYALNGKEVGTCALSDEIFGISPRSDILARVVRWQLARRRQGTHASKGISDVSGTTRKPYKQKGTGRARQGSLRSPQFRGGGIIFGPQPRDHAHHLTKKVRALGLKSALSAKVSSKQFFVLSELPASSKTKASQEVFKNWKGSVLVVRSKNPEGDKDQLALSIRNLHKVDVLPVEGLNVYDILRYDLVLCEKESLERIEKRLSA